MLTIVQGLTNPILQRREQRLCPCRRTGSLGCKPSLLAPEVSLSSAAPASLPSLRPAQREALNLKEVLPATAGGLSSAQGILRVIRTWALGPTPHPRTVCMNSASLSLRGFPLYNVITQ